MAELRWIMDIEVRIRVAGGEAVYVAGDVLEADNRPAIALVDRDTEAMSRHWSVTHVATGMQICAARYEDRATAVGVAEMLAQDAPPATWRAMSGAGAAEHLRPILPGVIAGLPVWFQGRWQGGRVPA